MPGGIRLARRTDGMDQNAACCNVATEHFKNAMFHSEQAAKYAEKGGDHARRAILHIVLGSNRLLPRSCHQ
jgi:hypothetical protein